METQVKRLQRHIQYKHIASRHAERDNAVRTCKGDASLVLEAEARTRHVTGARRAHIGQRHWLRVQIAEWKPRVTLKGELLDIEQRSVSDQRRGARHSGVGRRHYPRGL